MRLAFNAALVSLLLGASALPSPLVAWASGPLSVGGSATVTGTGGLGLRVRSGASVQRRVLSVLPEGRSVLVLEGPVAAGGETWYRVRSESIAGWAMARYLAPPTSTAATAWRPQPAVTATRPALATATRAPQGVTAAGAGADVPRSFVARVTGYASGEDGVGTRTATGTDVRWGVISVDPGVIPLGSQVEIEGFGGRFVAEDTGGAVRGAHVDVWLPDPEAARSFGTQTRRVTVVSEGSAR